MILAILQARMSSSRLPGKVLKDLVGRPMLGRQIDRLRRCRTIDRLVIATSVDQSDAAISAFAAAEGIGCHRGPLNDVLGRYAETADKFGPADHVVRLTADCPLTDPQVIDDVIALHLRERADYTSNSVERTFPKGLDVEVMTQAALMRAHAEADTPSHREHVTMYIYRNPELFRIVQHRQHPDRSALRWTVDYPQDFAMVEQVYRLLLPEATEFGQAEILACLAEHPGIAAMNEGLV